MLRRLSLLAHRYLGLVAAIVIVAVSVTGSALVVRDAVEGWLHPDVMQVEPAGDIISPDSALARVRAIDLERSPRMVEFPDSPRDPYAVWLTGPAQQRIMVDPYRGTVLGENARRGGVMGTLFVWHVELAAGDVGAWIVGLLGIGLLLLALTGLVIAWPGWRRLRRIFIVKWRRRWRVVNYDLHRAGGMWTLLFVVLTSATGAGLFFYGSTAAFLDWVTGTEPTRTATPTSAPPTPEAERISLRRAVDQARTALPEGRPTYLYLPQSADAPVTIRMRVEGEWHPNGRSFVYVDSYEGSVLQSKNALHAPAGRQILHTMYPLHIGSVGGTWVRVLYVLLGLGPAVLTISGVIIWYVRWRDRKGREGRSGPPESVRKPQAPPELETAGRSQKRSPREKYG